MTAMFRPPIAVTKAIGWAEVFGFNHGDDPFWAKVRGAQLASVSRYVPFNLACLAINVVGLGAVMRGVGDPAVLSAFAAALGLLIMVWVSSWLQRRRRPRDAAASRGDVWLFTAKVVAFGLLWALLLLYILPRAAPSQQLYIALLAMTVMGAASRHRSCRRAASSS